VVGALIFRFGHRNRFFVGTGFWRGTKARTWPPAKASNETISRERRNHPEADAAFYAGVTSAGTWRKDEFDGRVSSGRRGFG
jgi:hypothetical protein